MALILTFAVSSLAQTPTVTATPEEEEPTATVMATATEEEPTTTPEPIATEEEEAVEPAPTPTVTRTVQIYIAEAVGGAAITEEVGLELTVYNNNLGLVKDVRTLDLAEGLNEVTYEGVPTGIQPGSVHVTPLGEGGLTILEQNYAYDLGDLRRLTRMYIGEDVTLRTVAGTEYDGTLLSGGDTVILAVAGGIQVIRFEEIQEITFPEIEGLTTQPTLRWLLQAAEAGTQDVRVMYLTNGLNWTADYAMVFDQDENLTLNGWITLENNSGATYEEAQLRVVAGDVARAEPAPRVRFEAAREEAEMAAAAAPQVEQRGFFEYQLYEVQRPVTVREGQTKQIEFTSASGVDAESVYIFEASPDVVVRPGNAITDPGFGLQEDTPVQVRLVFSNTQEAGLGIPLPQGRARVYREEGGALLFVGADRIDHTPQGERIALQLGNAFDLVGERRQVDFESLGENSLEETYAITLTNRKEEDDVVIQVIEHLFRATESEIIESSMEYERVDANTIRFDVAVEAGASEALTYTVRYEW
jgi:hypothetical protein